MNHLEELKSLAERGNQVDVGYFPSGFWPNEEVEIDPEWRWRCFITEVPGTDMCVSPGYADTLEGAIEEALAVYRHERAPKHFPKYTD